MKKNAFSLLIAALLLLSLAACGAPAPAAEPTDVPVAEPTEEPAAEPTEEPAAEPTEEPVAAPVAEPAEEPTAEPAASDASERKALAATFIDKPLSELIAAIGEPDSSDYQPSCMPVGAEDGLLTYDGFSVYTLRTADGEIVVDVM